MTHDEFLRRSTAALEMARASRLPRGHEGDGVVVVGGGKYLPSVYVTARMALDTTAAPVQVWHRGPEEMPAKWRNVFADLGVETVDALGVPTAYPANTAGFALKTFAVTHCPFERVLMLDADSYPVDSLRPLFAGAGARFSGAVFWPDAPFTNDWTRWEFWGVDAFGPPCGWETGQYFIDKGKCWPALALARWYDDQAEHTYHRFHRGERPDEWRGDHGDKGSWRVAFAALKQEPHFYQQFFSYWPPAVVHLGPEGKPLFVHRTRDKFRTDCGEGFRTTKQLYQLNKFVPELPGERRAWGYYFEYLKILSGGR